MTQLTNSRLAWFNGKFMPGNQVLIPFRDRSWRYGDGGSIRSMMKRRQERRRLRAGSDHQTPNRRLHRRGGCDFVKQYLDRLS